jgi:hypothetical protein
MRTKFNLLLVSSALLFAAAVVQSADTNSPTPFSWTANQDHQNMMDQLGIKSLRPGADGNNRQAPNYQNTDENSSCLKTDGLVCVAGNVCLLPGGTEVTALVRRISSLDAKIKMLL